MFKPSFIAVVRLGVDGKIMINLYILETFPAFYLSFSDKPRFPKCLTNIEVDEGQELTLSIQCSAVPEPKIKW
jgi:hypothetical protein